MGKQHGNNLDELKIYDDNEMSVESPQKFHIQPEKLDIDFKSEIYS